jgi:mediator of RNA polymerase II transcription subunit 10
LKIVLPPISPKFCRNDVVGHLAAIDDMAQHVSTMIPMQVIVEIDSARNPMQLTRERLERAATENQFMNGKIAAITVGLFVML